LQNYLFSAHPKSQNRHLVISNSEMSSTNAGQIDEEIAIQGSRSLCEASEKKLETAESDINQLERFYEPFVLKMGTE